MDIAIVERLKKALGERWVSDTPETLIAYSREMQSYARWGWRDQRADCVVLPANAYQIQQIMAIAREFNVPVIAWGSNINIFGWNMARKGGIICDMKRLDKILDINMENMTATVQTAVPMYRLECELHKRKGFITQPGAPSSVHIGSHFSHGIVCKANTRTGYVHQQIVGWEMVLPDSTILRTGSLADARNPEAFWKHGPGPDLGDFPRYAEGSLGIITAVTIRVHSADEICKPMWVIFDDIDKAVGFYEEFLHSENFVGSCIYSNFKYTGYFSDTAEFAGRASRVHPDFILAGTIQGTKRRVEYEEKLLRKLAKKHDARIPTDNMPFYQGFIDSQFNMAASLYSELCMRYFSYPGTGGAPTGMVWGPIYVIPTHYKILTKIQLEDPLTADPDKLDAAISRGYNLYPIDGGHYANFEYMLAGHPIDPYVATQVFPALAPKVWKELPKVGLGFDAKYQWARFGEMNVMRSYKELMTRLLKTVDEKGTMNQVWVLSP